MILICFLCVETISFSRFTSNVATFVQKFKKQTTIFVIPNYSNVSYLVVTAMRFGNNKSLFRSHEAFHPDTSHNII